MSNRPFKALSDKYLKKVKEMKGSISYVPEKPDSFSRSIDLLLEKQNSIDKKYDFKETKSEYSKLYSVYKRYISDLYPA